MSLSQQAHLMTIAGFAAAVAVSCASYPHCPQVLMSATRLIIVTTETMDTAGATLEAYERASPSDAWTRRGAPQPAVVGKAGLAWGHTFHSLVHATEPIKQEGDKRTPAGFFELGSAFGFEPASNAGHLKLSEGQHVCVDEPASPHYSQIVSRQVAGEGTSGEEMWRIPAYKRGIVIDYPTSGSAKAGSCIFLHIWDGAGQGTSGCVAAPEARIAELQGWAGTGSAAIAILPASARERFKACMP